MNLGHYDAKIHLGYPARDKVSGFVGIVVARAIYLTGAPQLCLQPRVNSSGGWTEFRWFDEERIETDLDRPPAIGFSP